MKIEHNPATPHKLAPEVVMTMTEREADDIRLAMLTAYRHRQFNSEEQANFWRKAVAQIVEVLS